MPQTLELSLNHQQVRSQLTDVTTAKALQLYRTMDVQFLDQSWDRVAPALTTLVTASQVTAAGQADTYVSGIAAAYGDTSAAPKLVTQAFGGVALDGREIGPAMFSSVTTTKRLIGQGVAGERAFEAGAFYLASLIGTLVQDAGRAADMVAASARKYTHYVRVVSPGACSRCAILAGKSSYRTAFQRHPRCRCIAEPLPDGNLPPQGRGRYDSPEDYFFSLSRAEQDLRFTKAGAEAIRNGADPIKVVNARRGYFGSAPAGVSPRRLRPIQIGVKSDGSPLMVYATSEGTTVRGAFGKTELRLTGEATKAGRYRRTTSLRLMPEQIVIMAGDNTARLVELLQRYGYLY